ncbi:putative aldehyde reductase i [Kockovaella imperatae]|uniref:Putative aldehyde reductase i n=1 Tax=Kockovaella imperatae TaxID=4999 RepID=A0A1Y1U694_9TREE|nr:putative aldehyde reductase i [Kockovaella imperatae]ORX33560.1 putative aldehyde reductase i [Kockovaella imperatae]
MVPSHFTLSNGKKIPSIGLGTWQSKPGEVKAAVEAALKSGYRHIDCAWGYGNENEVGEGIKASGVPREEIWITSKLFEYHHEPKYVEMALKDTLKKLGVDYLDLYLMHWNICFQVDAPEGELPLKEHLVKNDEGTVKLNVPLSDDVTPTWQALEACVEKGLTKAIGVSNLNINRTKQVLKIAKIKPVANQVELSIQCPQPELVSWLQKNDILPCAYSPLGGTDGQKLRENETVVKIAEKHNVQGATVLISWLLKRGICVLPKSVTPSRIESNLKTVDLSEEDFQAIEKLAESHPPNRVCDQSTLYDPHYDIYQEKSEEFSDKKMWAQEQ